MPVGDNFAQAVIFKISEIKQKWANVHFFNLNIVNQTRFFELSDFIYLQTPIHFQIPIQRYLTTKGHKKKSPRFV